MTNNDRDREKGPAAEVRHSYLAGWVWIIPAAAVLIVIWLAWDQLRTEGPAITITFPSADGLSAGTKIRHKSVDIGTIKEIELGKNLSHVVVTARMSRQVADHLGSDTQFWIVRPRLTPGGLTGLETIVSGVYIEMQPGRAGGPQREFKGLDQPPVMEEGGARTVFNLRANQVGSLNRGSPVYCHGISVGQVTRYELADHGAWVKVLVFIRAPYDKLVHHESLFWNVSVVSISTSGGGLSVSAGSLESMLAGGIQFDTPTGVLGAPSSPLNTQFPLYYDEHAARDQPVGPRVYYLVHFPGSISGLGVGASVQLLGIEVGRVSDVHMEYDRVNHRLETPVILEIRPDAIPGLVAPAQTDMARAVADALGYLIAGGLRARMSSSNLLTGQRQVPRFRE